jgi:glycosyltransferase involved in cell wall biosynthesis
MSLESLVSVIIPTYNYGHYIGDAIDSVLNSDFPDNQIEIIIVDDGSTDDTAQKLQPYRNRVKYIYQENSGKAQATRVAIEHSSGRYLFNLDADDFFLPQKIKTVVKIFEADSDITHVGHPAIYLDEQENHQSAETVPPAIANQKISGQSLLSFFYRHHLLLGGGSTFAARADALKRFPIPTEVDMFIDEYMVLAAVSQGCSFLFNEPLSVWRIHGKNFSYQDPDRHIQKIQRNLASMEAVQRQLPTLGLDMEIQRIYGLKTMGFNLLLKEKLRTKQWSDIFKIWAYVLDNLKFFGLETFLIAKNYYILNRSLPTPLINFLRQSLAH